MWGLLRVLVSNSGVPGSEGGQNQRGSMGGFLVGKCTHEDISFCL